MMMMYIMRASMMHTNIGDDVNSDVVDDIRSASKTPPHVPSARADTCVPTCSSDVSGASTSSCMNPPRVLSRMSLWWSRDVNETYTTPHVLVRVDLGRAGSSRMGCWIRDMKMG
jgi:hypothetical protein